MEVSLQAGRVVGEHWRLRGKLGVESTSRFWVAEGLRTRGLVAIEFSRVDLSDPKARLRFSDETQELTSFWSPHVVRTIQRGLESDDLAFAVTELLHGEDLDRVLARESALELVDVAQILDQVCRGITRLEAMRISHRVLEPKHVFVVAHGAKPRAVKLLNVGLGRRAAAASPWSPYAIPEHIGSTAPGDASQIWAIGVMSYRMLTGMLPFEPDQRRTPDADWLARVRLHASRADLPPGLDAWFQTAFERDPSQRFATVEQAGLAFGHIASTYAPGKPAPIRHVMDRTSPKPPPLPSKGANPSATAGEADRVARDRAVEGLALAVEWAVGRPGELDHATLQADPDAVPPPRTAADEVGRDSELASAVEAESSAVTDLSAEPVFEPVTRDRLIAQTAGSARGIHERDTLASRVHAASKQRKRVAVAESAGSSAPEQADEENLAPSAEVSVGAAQAVAVAITESSPSRAGLASAAPEQSSTRAFDPVAVAERERVAKFQAGQPRASSGREQGANPVRAAERERKPVRMLRDGRDCVPALALRESDRDSSLALGPSARIEEKHPLALSPANTSVWVEERRVRDRRSAFIIGRSDILAQTEHSAAERTRALQAERARGRASVALAVIFGLFLGFVLRSLGSNQPHTARPGLHRAATSERGEQREQREEGLVAHSAPESPPQPPAVAIAALPTVTAPTASPAQNPQPVTRARSRPAKRSSAPDSLASTELARPVPSSDLVATLPLEPRRDLGAAPLSDARRRDPANPQTVSAQTQARDTDALAPLDSVLRNAPPAARPALLPAAPPGPDTAPLQVYRGF